VRELPSGIVKHIEVSKMKKILVCEDDPDIQKSLKNILKKNDYDVYAAQDGKEAIDLAKKISPDAILLDIRMPKVDGLEVAREIRKCNTQTKIIFITAFQSPELFREAAQYNIFEYLVKPVSPEDILKTIRDAVNS
jgi:CheY-like chemotaxis protein